MDDMTRTTIELEAAKRQVADLGALLRSDDPEATEPETFEAYDAACDRFWDARADAERYGVKVYGPGRALARVYPSGRVDAIRHADPQTY